MKFSYTALNAEEKKLDINSLFPLENDDKSRWIWTSKKFMEHL